MFFKFKSIGYMAIEEVCMDDTVNLKNGTCPECGKAAYIDRMPDGRKTYECIASKAHSGVLAGTIFQRANRFLRKMVRPNSR